jgi:MFS family permease
MMNIATLRAWLGLERNIIVLLLILLVVGMGEELWARFLPKYLEVLGAGTVVIAAYGTLKDLLDAVYQYPGGWIVDHLGRRRGFVLFTLLAIVGYLIYALATDWPAILVGTLFVAAWSSLTLPAFFAVIGDNLPPGRRSIGFGVQATLKRVPIIVAPVLGGAAIAAFGIAGGMKAGFAATIILALVAIAVLLRFFDDTRQPPATHHSIGELWKTMDPQLKRLLVSDILARWAEGIPKVFIVLYAMNILGVSAVAFGWLTAVQMAAAIVAYIPMAKLADRANRKAYVLLTFVFFAAFPLALVEASGLTWIAAAFVVGGLREIGEPARKAMIVDRARASARGRVVGIYYLVRGLAVFAAPLAGGLLWTLDPRLPFFVAFGVGMIGCLIFALQPSGGMQGPQEGT